jgi:hypothetical protein
MAIPSKQIGWSQKAYLLWNISKQFENLIKVAGNVTLPTPSQPTVVIYSQSLSFPIAFASMNFTCDDSPVGNYVYTSETANDINELVTLFNSNLSTSVYGTFAAFDSTTLQLSAPTVVRSILCPNGTLAINIFAD